MNYLKIEVDKKYVLCPDKVWNGKDSEALLMPTVYISNGLIERISHPANQNFISPEFKIIRLPGVTLMPGLVDCHVHFAMNCENLFQAVNDWETNPGEVEKAACKYALNYLENGVLAVRDGGDKINIGLLTRNNIREKCFPGPLVTATGRAIYKKGGYGNFLGPGITTVREAVNNVVQFKEDGVDQIKVIVSGLVSFKKFGHVGPAQFSLAELKTIVETAHNFGLKVMTHASSAQAVETAVLAGADSVEHGYFLEDRQIELMLKHGTAWIPTLAPLGNLISKKHIPYDGADMDIIKRSFELQLKKVAAANNSGILLGIGTDSGANHVLHGGSYHDELAFYSTAGLSNLTILQAATCASASIIGKANQIGSISVGKQPFLIGVNGNPLDNLDVLKKPGWIIMP